MKAKFKILLVFLGCLLFRLLPLRAPNVEPIMASIMPLGRKYGAMTGFLFGFLSIILYDAVTHFGSWTWIAGITYGLIGAVSAWYFSKVHPEKGGAKSSILNFAVFAFLATIVFDFVTGVLFAPIFHESMMTALVLQIPFTLLHLAGNIGFAVTLSPILNKWLASEKVLVQKKFARNVLVK
jgi:uncharacterized membrane protein